MKWLLLLFLSLAFAAFPDTVRNLQSACEQGEDEVTYDKTGRAITLDHDSSNISKDDAGERTMLNLFFNVPYHYFFPDTVGSGSEGYERAFQITFHDWDRTPQIQDGCVTTRTESGVEYCSMVEPELWTHEEGADQCTEVVSGSLPWDDMFRNGWHNSGTIHVEDGSMTMNGETVDAWDVYMVARVETWIGIHAESNVVDGREALEILDERRSYYEIPFRITWPKTVTLESDPIRVNAPMIVLYAVVAQEVINIDFNPEDGEEFGRAHIAIRTQVQYPFALRDTQDQVAPALIRFVDGTGEIKNVIWKAPDSDTLESDPPASCLKHDDDGNQIEGHCEQEWHLEITPDLCDISGEFIMEAWAICYTDLAGCPLDSDAPSELSNSYTGELQFRISAQQFCPQVVDEIFVDGDINIFVDDAFEEIAVPGQNLFSNDMAYFEAVYRTSSEKSGNNADEGDDSMIQYVRPISIRMCVQMNVEPLQTEVESSYGDFSGTTLDYCLLLCEAEPATYPYQDDSFGQHDCFNVTNQGYNARTFMDFQREVSSGSFNLIDDNEVGFSARLDERVIPVDIPNDNAQITVYVDSEIYYFGNINPSIARRRLNYNVPNEPLISQVSSDKSDTITIMPQYDIEFCPLQPHIPITGFQLDMDVAELPGADNAASFAVDLKHALTQELSANWGEIEIYSVHLCASQTEECSSIWHINRDYDIDFDRVEGRRKLETYYVRYYIDVDGHALAERFEQALVSRTELYRNSDTFQNVVIRDVLVDHCDEELLDYFTKFRVYDLEEGNDGSGATRFFLGLVVALLFAFL